MSKQSLPSSFRDPSGFVFKRDGTVFRQVSPAFQPTFDAFETGGLYEALVSDKRLIPHERVEGEEGVLCPQQIPFISYPYEWSFQQLKEAALLTLGIAEEALAHGMVLKDASAYNVQFLDGAPIFIDTLSFEPYEEGAPWIAYGQFCRHFLAPLWLMAHVDYRCILLLRDHIDGIPLDYAVKLLGKTKGFSLTEYLHLRMHAKMQTSKAADQGKSTRGKQLSKTALIGLLDNLKSGIRKLEWKAGKTEWGDYYNNTNYSSTAAKAKRDLIDQVVSEKKPDSVWDIGANDGTFSRIAARYAKHVASLDIDPVAVNLNYKKNKAEGASNLLPLMVDFTNPSPALGWLNEERDSLFQRTGADLVMALAVVHHFCISNNVSLERLTSFFAASTRKWLVVEFVPKSDSQVEILLATRADIFPEYNLASFKAALETAFELTDEYPIEGSERTLLIFEKRS